MRIAIIGVRGIPHTYAGGEEFAEAIRLCMEENSPQLKLARRAAILEHSWPKRMEFMWQAITEMLESD